MSTGTADNGTMTKEPKSSPLATIKKLLQGDAFKDAIAKALPKHMTPDRFCRVAINATMQTPKLLECSQESLFGALMKLSQYGLEPDGRRAHLIPYGNQVQLVIDYKGLAELIYRSGLVSVLHADIVCENDTFVYSKGQLHDHTPNFKLPRGKPYAVYALCVMKDKSEKCDVMTIEEVEAIRSRSKAGKSGPWVTDFNEMAKKTVFRRLSKWLPLSPEIRDAVESDDDQIDLTEEVRTVQSTATTKVDMVEELLRKRMTQTDEAANDDPVAEETKTPATLAELLARIPNATRTSDLHEIGDAGSHLTKQELTELVMALEDRGEEIKNAK